MYQSQTVLPFRPALPAGGSLTTEDHPARRLVEYGASSLHDSELLGLLLPAADGEEATRLARAILERLGGLAQLIRTSDGELARNEVEPAHRVTLLAAAELARRLARTRLDDRELLNNPGRTAEYLLMRYYESDQEVMGALYLDVRNHLIADREIYRGILSQMMAEPRAILKHGLLCSAANVVLFHTHPSGDPEPSCEDLEFTRRMAKVAEIVGIPLRDHLILGGGGRWVSLYRRGVW